MRHIPVLIFSLALAALVLSCVQESESQIVTKEYSASFVENCGTKTTITDNYSVSWKQGDVVQYYDAANGDIGRFTIEEDGKYSRLRLNVRSDASFLIATYNRGYIYENTSGSRFTIGGVFGETQSGSFEDAHISVAKTYDINTSNLVFSNITSLIKFKINRTDISYIVFSSNGKESIHGNGTVICSFDGEKPSASFNNSTGSSIKIQTNGGGVFYLATIPCTLSSGFTIQCYDDNDEVLADVKTTKQITLAENQILNLGTLDSHLTEKERPTIQYKPNLSEKGTANCYIVPMKGDYYFKADVKGNSTEKLPANATGVKVLWESNGTLSPTSVGDIITNISYSDGIIHFTSTGKNGNAVVAITNRDEDVIWSWHIWCVMGYDPDFYQQTYKNNAGVMMDRNLGAITANPLKQGSAGLYYQFGRKDPFPYASFAGSTSKTTTSCRLDNPVNVTSIISSGNTLEYATHHPTTLIFSNSAPYDWYSVTSDYSSDGLWSETKSRYDPCPRGWKIPSGEGEGVWAKAMDFYGFTSAENIWKTNYIDFSEYTDSYVTIPAVGHVFQSKFQSCGVEGLYRTTDPYVKLFFFEYRGSSTIAPSSRGYGHERENATSIRCQRE